MQLTYPAIFYYHKDDGVYVVVVPDLPGCVSYGETLAEAIMMGTDAASGWVLDEFEDGKPAPKASPIWEIHPDPEDGGDGFVSVLVLDMDAFEKKYGKKSVRKSFTIPAWLDTFAEERHVDYSRVLQDSLMDMYVRENSVTYQPVQ